MNRRRWLLVQACLACLLLITLQSCDRIRGFLAPSSGEPQLTARELAVIVNQADPLSIEIARYYQQQRRIPDRNLITIRFKPGRTTLEPQEFQQLKAQIDTQLPAHIQALALTWAAPYRVGCMSITSAFAFGFDNRYCAQGCLPTQTNPYFRQDSATPYTDFKVRPTMAIAATRFEQAKSLIDRGVASDGTYPPGAAYLMDTSDRSRNVRTAFYANIQQQLASLLPIRVIKADTLEGQTDVMFYFTGLSQVQQIATNHFLPGAIADHLTSAGGMLTDSQQMSSLRWLEAGATGSYGAVVEPCNFPQKFPHPGLVISNYLAGDTLLEAYWKSVAWAGQGIFVGEPLARPYSFPRNQ